MKSIIFAMCLLGAFADSSDDLINISPSVLSGILIVLMMLVFFGVALNSLMSIDGPTVYSNVPLLVGKER